MSLNPNDERRLAIVQQMQTALAIPEAAAPSGDRIANLVARNSRMLPLFAPSGIITADRARSVGADQKALLDLTFQDLQRLTRPLYVGLTEFLDYLKYKDPKDLLYSYSSLGDDHIGTSLPAKDPGLMWFVDLSFRKRKMRDPELANKPRTLSGRLRSRAGFDPKVEVEAINRATFLLADSTNLNHITTRNNWEGYGSHIYASIYNEDLAVDSEVSLNDDGRMIGVRRVFGIQFDDPGKTGELGSATAIVSFPDDLSPGKYSTYPVRRLRGKNYPIFNTTYAIGHPASHFLARNGAIEYYRLNPADGYFRRNTFDTDKPTIQDEIVAVLARLPALRQDLG